MAEFILTERDTRVLREAIELGLGSSRKPGAGMARRIAKLLARIEKRQQNTEIYLELPDAEDV